MKITITDYVAFCWGYFLACGIFRSLDSQITEGVFFLFLSGLGAYLLWIKDREARNS